MPSHLRQRIYALLRITGITLAALFFALFALVQFQQHLLRHRAEELNADIAWLRDHPGTWADLQRIQRRWGAFAHYDGTCDHQHCNYHIEFGDLYFRIDRQRGIGIPLWLLNSYIRLGGRPVWINTELRLTQNHLWGTHIDIATGITPMVKGLEGIVLGAEVYFGPRLFSWPHERQISLAVYRDRNRIGQPTRCMFCIEKWVVMTPSTPKTDRDRLAVINFSCITRFHPCTGIADILPNVAAQEDAETRSPQRLKDPRDAYGDPRCEVPLGLRATEAQNIVAVEIVSSEPSKDPQGKIDAYSTTAKIVMPLKNALDFRSGDVARFYSDTHLLNPPPAVSSPGKLNPLPSGNRYIVLFQHPFSVSSMSFQGEECSVIPDTPQARAKIAKGIANDPSASEEYSPYH